MFLRGLSRSLPHIHLANARLNWYKFNFGRDPNLCYQLEDESVAGDQDGLFFVIEGIDGCGKSTQIKQLGEYFRLKGRQVHVTCEPTDGHVGVLIRKMLSGEVKVDQRTIATLFAADRTDHLMNEENGIRNKVDKGQVVLCDRYYFSSYAYHAQHVDMDWVIRVNSMNAEILKPDATLFIDVDPDTCFKRLQRGRAHLEMYEKIDIMNQVRLSYFEAFERLKDQETVRVIDGNGEIEQVQKRIRKAVDEIMALTLKKV